MTYNFDIFEVYDTDECTVVGACEDLHFLWRLFVEQQRQANVS